MGKRKKATGETEAELVEQSETKVSGKWIAKINVICGGGVSLKKGDDIPADLLESLISEGFAEQVG